MAVTVYVRDLINYPGNQKTITVNLTSLIPKDQSGDEKWVISLTTNAYADANNTAIQDIYLTHIKRGWCRSSGIVGSMFNIGTGHALNVVIDGATGTTTVYLTSGTNLTGEDVARDLQTKLRALADSSGSQAGDLGYKNCVVEFRENRFWIYSGTVSDSYTGTSQSSVTIGAAQFGVDCRHVLGFDITTSSYELESNPCMSAALASDYTRGTSTLTIGDHGWTVTSGQAYMIRNAQYSDYFISLAGSSGNTIVVPEGVIAHDYSTATGSRTLVTLLKPGDEINPVCSPMETIDDVVRWGIESITNQIYFAR